MLEAGKKKIHFYPGMPTEQKQGLLLPVLVYAHLAEEPLLLNPEDSSVLNISI